MPGLNFKGTNKYQKIAESMLKKTRFTESEIDRLSDLHANILVRTVFVVWIYIYYGTFMYYRLTRMNDNINIL